MSLDRNMLLLYSYSVLMPLNQNVLLCSYSPPMSLNRSMLLYSCSVLMPRASIAPVAASRSWAHAGDDEMDFNQAPLFDDGIVSLFFLPQRVDGVLVVYFRRLFSSPL